MTNEHEPPRRSLLWTAAKSEWVAVALITVIAAIPRLVMLASVPAGFHGDEGWTGIDAQRVLDSGLIGPYVESAVGQPTGPLYFAAPFVGILGHTIFSVRLAMAVLGIATIPVAYVMFRVSVGRGIATFAALFLAVSVWHLHFSRIAFMVISWPLLEMIVLLCFFIALRGRSNRWFALTGLALGAGVYTYNAYAVFLISFFLLVAAVGAIAVEDLGRYLRQVGLLTLCAVVAAVPLLLYIADNDHDYFYHQRDVSLFRTTEWRGADAGDRIEIVVRKGGDYVNDIFWNGDPEYVDGTGTTAMVDGFSAGLLMIGLLMALWRWREPPYLALLIMALMIPLATLFTNAAPVRRSLGVVPLFAGLQALPVAFLWDRSRTFKPHFRWVASAMIVILFLGVTALNMKHYFSDFRGSSVSEVTFWPKYTSALESVDALPGEPYVYFLDELRSFDYEVRRYLAPDMQGEDRSAEFNYGNTDLLVDRSRDIVFILMGAYVERINDLTALYPTGKAYSRLGDEGNVEFVSYYVPAAKPGESPVTKVVPTSTPKALPGGENRDNLRMRDLRLLGLALEAFKSTTGSYPSTNGNIETLCAYEEDAWCEVESDHSQIPEDPLGSPFRNGYFYSSDGEKYTIFAIRETALFTACPAHPTHLREIASLLCVES